jgi:hypothetical protein
MPWIKVLNFTDPFPYQAAIRAAEVEIFPRREGNFAPRKILPKSHSGETALPAV